MIMLFNNNNCKPQANAKNTENNRNSEQAEETANSLRIAINYSDFNIKSPHRHKGFNGINSPSPQGGFVGINFSGGDGRTRQKQSPSVVAEGLAETNVCHDVGFSCMQNSNFSDGTNPIITQGCPKCKSEYGVFGEGKGPHYASLYCGCCGRFIKWMPKPRIKQNDSAQLNNGGIR